MSMVRFTVRAISHIGKSTRHHGYLMAIRCIETRSRSKHRRIRQHPSWGRRSGRGQAACSGSRHAPRKSPGGSRATDGRPHRSCSTSGPGCSHGSCDRNRRMSSMWSGEHHRNHQQHHRRRILHDRRRCIRRLGSSCGQCDQPGRTCSTLGYHRHGHPWGRRRPWCIRGRCGQYHRSGSMSSRPGEKCIHG